LGFGAGVTVAAVWNGLNLFVTHLMQAGAVAFWSFLHTGHLQRLDTMMVTLGGIGHFILIISCLAAQFHTAQRKKWLNFAIGGTVAFAYLILIVIIARPR
jgi:hypothetical protein